MINVGEVVAGRSHWMAIVDLSGQRCYEVVRTGGKGSEAGQRWNVLEDI